MTKTIKFNLILDGKPVRDLEGLQNNYNIDDIYANYQSGVLSRWLEVRGYKDHLIKINNLKSTDEMTLAKNFSKIFEVGISDEDIETSVYAIRFRKEEKDEITKFDLGKAKRKDTISKYHQDYIDLQSKIIQNKEDFVYIKQAINEICENYRGLFYFNHIEFYYRMIKEAPLSIFAILMNNTLRDLYLQNSEVNDEIKELFNNKFGSLIDIRYSNNLIAFFIDEGGSENIADNKPHYLKKYFKMYNGKTDSYWKDIEEKDKKFMIINIQPGNFVRNSGKTGEEFSASEINGNYLILNGIDYKSNNNDHRLIYMEV